MIGSWISSFIDMNAILSATNNFFLGRIFLMIWLIFFKSQFFQVCGIRHDGDIHYRLESNCSQKEICNFIFFPSLFLVVF